MCIVGILYSSILYAAVPTETPCEPCSSADIWTGPYRYTTSQAIPGSSCTIIISYWTRTCTATGEPQIKIDTIAPQPNCSTLTTPYSDEEIAILAMGDLLQSNPMGFAPTVVGTTKDWAVLRPACWQKLQTGELIGCSTQCCTSRVTAELFMCLEGDVRGISDHGYSNTLTPPIGPLPSGCACKCDNIFKRYREIIGNKP